jgi:hypothetical protein
MYDRENRGYHASSVIAAQWLSATPLNVAQATGGRDRNAAIDNTLSLLTMVTTNEVLATL